MARRQVAHGRREGLPMYNVLFAAFLQSAAFAQDSTAPVPATPTPVTPAPVEERPYHHEFSFRGRMMTVPDSILDIWYFAEDEDGWPLGGDAKRPQARGYGLGIEYCIKGPAANGIFYFDYMDATMPEGYWDDREEPADHLDGSYLVPSKNFGMVAFGADFAYEVHFVRTSDTNGAFGLSLLPGGGLGVAVVTGQIDEWTPEGGVPAYVSYQSGNDPDKTVKIPKVLPMVDLNLSLRFNFGDRVVLRTEAGLHDIVYYGAAVGIMF